MADKSTMWLHSTSMVILAESHNPSTLNRDFLVLHDIIPEEWTVTETLVTPLLSVIQYDNGIRLQVHGRRLEISKECDLPLCDYTDDWLYGIATSYVDILSYMPYQGLGVNYTVSVVYQNPSEWITKRFLKFAPWDEKFYMTPRFSIDMTGAKLNLDIHSKEVSRKGDSYSSVVVDYNLHYDGPFDTASLCDRIHGCTDNKRQIADVLGKILGD